MLSVVLTWPLLRGLGTDVPGDLGDSLLNMWILGWGVQKVPQVLTLQLPLESFWNANIFHPEPLSLALSEHLFGQVLQILPVYWLTGNIILSYNLLFIATFALSAFGTFLLVRDLTGDSRAAFVAGLVYGFLPYRIASVPHLQVMSSQWMPFALWGLNRYVTARPAPGPRLPRRAALGFGIAALVLQNWSCGYYLLYFAPFLPLFLIHRMWIAGTLGSVRIWAGLIAGAIVTFTLTLPFLLPYLSAQRHFGIERPFAEVAKFSANAWSYLTASENLILWGGVWRFSPRAEGETFLGVMPWLLAAVALWSLLDRRGGPSTAPGVGRIITIVLSLIVAVQMIGLIAVMLFGGFDLGVISARSPGRLLIQFTIALAALLAISSRARVETVRLLRSPITIVFIATLLAMWLSMGADSSLYRAFYEHVPGFNGVRVPARYAMIAGLFLAILAGFGTLRVLRKTASGRIQTAIVSVFSAMILLEGAAIPFEINRTWHHNEATPPPHVTTYPNAPAVYQRLKALPTGSVVTEFPFGDGAWEIRYVYYAAAHLKPITNGYSGSFPPRYQQRVALLRDVTRNPDLAWQSLKDTGTTHVVVHRNAFADGANADALEAWLRSRGAVEAERFDDGDILFKL